MNFSLHVLFSILQKIRFKLSMWKKLWIDILKNENDLATDILHGVEGMQTCIL